MIIGVTGPSGAGKSLFCSFFREKGFTVLDCDEIYHHLTSAPSECTAELSLPENFGPSVIRADGSLDRMVLASIVFKPGAENKLLRLNEITHKYVHREVLDTISALPPGTPGVVVDAPLLFQAGFDADCDFTVAILAPKDLRLSRLKIRDNISDQKLRARLDAAPSDDYYISRCDRVVVNTGDTDALRRDADNVIRAAADVSNTKINTNNDSGNDAGQQPDTDTGINNSAKTQQ